jgi:hypothetical protein
VAHPGPTPAAVAYEMEQTHSRRRQVANPTRREGT